MRYIYLCLLFCMAHFQMIAGDCIFPANYSVEEMGSGPYTYVFTVNIDTINGNDTKALEITFMLSGGTTTTLCYPPGTYSDPITHNFFNESTSGQTGKLTYVSWTANNGQCQGGSCSSGTLDNTLLPMTLLDFEVEEENGVVRVKWITANEINHDRYVIERSNNLIDFDVVEALSSTGSEFGETHYEIVDEDAPSGSVYYRLKSVDLDGSFEYSAVASILITEDQTALFPNPTKGKVFLAMAALIEVAGPVYLIDATGQRIPLKVEIIEGQLQLDLTRFKSGIYIIQTPLRAFRVIRF